VNTLQQQPVEGSVKLNEVVKAVIETASPLVYDPYTTLSATGSAILIDETSNSTVAAVLIK
jgi:sulfate adenylyltransferase subunit 1